MHFLILLQGLGSVSFFASRAFLPAFVTALLLRFGTDLPWLRHAGLLSQAQDLPTWFTSDAALVVLGILSVLEFVAQRSPEARLLLDQVHDYLKAGMAALTYLGVVKTTEHSAIVRVIKQAGLFDVFPLLIVSFGTFFATQLRGAIFQPLLDADEDDHLGVQRLIRWLGDLWGVLGPVVLIVFPLITVCFLLIAVVILFLIERLIQREGDRRKVECVNCFELIHASALACPSCSFKVDAPRAVDLLGRSRRIPADRASLPFGLVAAKRCPVCATRFDLRMVKQVCSSCDYRLMDDPEFAGRYVGFVDRRVPFVCLVCFGLGLVPVFGVIPGVIYFRLAIVAPFRRYIPPGRGFLLHWGVGLASVGLAAFQWVPFAGAIALPSMALINYAVYRAAYRRLALAS